MKYLCDMKVQHIKTTINEVINKKIKIDEESFFEGHNFITYGKEINLVDIDLPLIKIKKDSLIVKWTGKPEFHNDGMYAFNIDVKSVTGESEEDGKAQAGPLNFNGFEHVITKRKNAEIPEVQVFIQSVYIATQEKKIHIEFTI